MILYQRTTDIQPTKMTGRRSRASMQLQSTGLANPNMKGNKWCYLNALLQCMRRYASVEAQLITKKERAEIERARKAREDRRG